MVWDPDEWKRNGFNETKYAILKVFAPYYKQKIRFYWWDIAISSGLKTSKVMPQLTRLKKMGLIRRRKHRGRLRKKKIKWEYTGITAKGMRKYKEYEKRDRMRETLRDPTITLNLKKYIPHYKYLDYAKLKK